MKELLNSMCHELRKWELPQPSEEALAKLETYGKLLMEKNRVMNLTAVAEPEGIVMRHFLESISVALAGIKEGSQMIDVGCGAGFPGLPLKIYCDGIGLDTRLTLLDSTAKKITFLQQVCTEAKVHAEFKSLRAEEAAAGCLREKFDFAMSRAVARMDILCELCMPFVRPGGRFLALKTDRALEEIRQAERAILLLGGKREKDIHRQIDATGISLCLVVINKISQTPPKYPRKFAQIKTKPL